MIKQIISRAFTAGNVTGQYSKINRFVSSCSPANTVIRSEPQKKTVSKKDFAQLMTAWPAVKEDLFNFTRKFDTRDTGMEYYNRALEHIVADGHILFALTSLHAFKRLVDNPSVEDMKRAEVLAWFCEMFMGAYNLIDDIGDQGTERRGLPCWHRVEDVGLRATNDASLVITGAYRLLAKYFDNKDCYNKIVSIWHEAEHITGYGMSLEYTVAKQNILEFTESDMWAIWQCKVHFFYSTVASSLCQAGITDPEIFRRVFQIATEIGFVFQIHNDFEDVYADQTEHGKAPTDIQENKLTWFAVTAGKLGNARQREILKHCYGSYDPDKVAQVKQVYNELGLFEANMKLEEQTYLGILDKMHNLGRLEDVFQKLLMIYKNNKSKQFNEFAPRSAAL